MDLSHNNLNGGIPPQLLDLPSLSIGLDLSDNPLGASLPPEVAKLQSLSYLGVSNTMLSGELSSTLGSCVALEYLHMDRNFFQGAIPSTWSNLGGLRELDLSQNNLSGQIPEFLTRFPLDVLNLSYNNFEREVPIGGIFSNVTRLSISGNKHLCGGIPDLKLPPCNFNKAGRKRPGHRRRLIISILSGVFGVILLSVFVLLYAFSYKKKRKEPETET